MKNVTPSVKRYFPVGYSKPARVTQHLKRPLHQGLKSAKVTRPGHAGIVTIAPRGGRPGSV